MSLQRFLTAHTFVLFVCIPVWSQDFGTLVSGDARTQVRGGIPPCPDHKYDQTGKRSSTGEAVSECIYSRAGADSTADLEKSSQGSVGGYSHEGGFAFASSQVMTFDTVTLIPPSTFNGDQVTFKMVDSYTTTVDNVHLTLCWTVPHLVNDCITTTSSTTKGTISKWVTLPKSASGFQFQVTKLMTGYGTEYSGHFSASFSTTGDPDFILPAGWTCSFASGRLCR